MKPKKDAKTKVAKTQDGQSDGAQNSFSEVNTKEELKTFLQSVREKIRESSAASIYALSAMNYIMNLSDIYNLLDNENKEIARDIWLRIKQSGMQVKTPPMLFKAEEEAVASALA